MSPVLITTKRYPTYLEPMNLIDWMLWFRSGWTRDRGILKHLDSLPTYVFQKLTMLSMLAVARAFSSFMSREITSFIWLPLDWRNLTKDRPWAMCASWKKVTRPSQQAATNQKLQFSGKKRMSDTSESKTIMLSYSLNMSEPEFKLLTYTIPDSYATTMCLHSLSTEHDVNFRFLCSSVLTSMG